MGMLDVYCGCYMHTYGHKNISETPKYPSAATNMRVWNIVQHSIKATLKHNIYGEKVLKLQHIFLKIYLGF